MELSKRMTKSTMADSPAVASGRSEPAVGVGSQSHYKIVLNVKNKTKETNRNKIITILCECKTISFFACSTICKRALECSSMLRSKTCGVPGAQNQNGQRRRKSNQHKVGQVANVHGNTC